MGNYPRKGVQLHSQFAKLYAKTPPPKSNARMLTFSFRSRYLYSMAFRGIEQPSFKSPDIAADIDALAETSLHCASAILHAVVDDEEMQGHLNGLPMYFDVMIAFAVVFVLKVSTKYASSVPIDTSHIPALVESTVRVLQRVTASMHPRHLLVSVAKGAASLFEKTCPGQVQGAVPANAHVTMSQPTFDESLYDLGADWNNSTFDNFYMVRFEPQSTVCCADIALLCAGRVRLSFKSDDHEQLPARLELCHAADVILWLSKSSIANARRRKVPSLESGSFTKYIESQRSLLPPGSRNHASYWTCFDSAMIHVRGAYNVLPWED